MSYSDEAIIAKYLELRAQREAIENKHKLELMPIKDAMNILENVMGAILADRGEKNSKTEIGTAYTKGIFTVKVTDRNAFLNYVFNELEDIELVDIKPNETAIDRYLTAERTKQMQLPEEQRVAPSIPGITTDRLTKTQFRKA